MQETGQNLKYTIKSRIGKMPGTPRSNSYKICAELGISFSTLNNWMNLVIGDKFSIPVEDFYRIANQLGCTPDELFTTRDLIKNG
nr:helix-turn-helix transcriptional regulator [Pedobacter kyonggii]